MRVSNNLIYRISSTVFADNHHIGGIHIGSRTTSYVYNNTIYDIYNQGGGNPSGAARGILAKAWPVATGAATVIATNNYVGNVRADFDASFPCFLTEQGGVFTQSHNVTSDGTAAGTGSQTGKTAYATYFKNTTAGAEDLHLLNYSLALWGSSGIDLSHDASLPVTQDVDGGTRLRPDIGADEFGVCCGLSTTEAAGSTVTVTGTGQFEMRFNAATGGGIDQLYDLSESPLRDASHDLAGGVNDLRALHDFEIAPNGGPFAGVNHTTEDNSSGSRVELLEATATRVRVRQDALFQEDGGTNILGGLEGFGDYSVYGSGRTAVGWTEKDWNTPLFVYARRQIGMTGHHTGGPPLNDYAPCYEGNVACNSSGGGGAAADWLLGVRDAAGARTDFLTILSQDWVQATTVEYYANTAVGQEFNDQV